MSANEEQARRWSESSANWLAVEPVFELIGGSAGAAAMELLELRDGQRILDVGCGSGITTVELAARVAPGGVVVGIDIAADLIARAEQRAADAGRANVSFVVADAQVHTFSAQVFDAAYSRFGVMFFEDPGTAFATLRGALRPGAPLAFACWDSVMSNEWVLLPALAIASVTGTVPAPPGAGEPGPFSMADPEGIRQLLESVGFRDVVIDTRRDTVVLDEIATGAMTRFIQAGPLHTAMGGADPETMDRIDAAIQQALSERAGDDGVVLARSYHVVGATA